MGEILFLPHRVPYPPTKGDKVRSFHLLRQLSRSHRVHLGTFVDDPDDWAHLDAVRALCAETCIVGLDGTRARLRSLGGLLRREPLTLPYYRSARLARWVREILASRPIESVLVFSSAMAQYVRPSPRPGLRRVADFVDVDSDKWRQYAERKTWPMSWVYAREARRLLAYERAVAADFDAGVFVSAAEADLFRRLAPEVGSRITHANNGVDAEFFAPDGDYPSPYDPGEQVLAFTGAMDYWANVDAVRWFAREVFPRVRARVDAARFYVVGARPAREVRELAREPGVVVTGTVADVRPYLAHARVAVAPLRVARGIQNKVLEAMAMGRPVVASPQAMEGIEPCPGATDGASDEPQAMAEAALRLLGDPAQAAARGRRGRECILRHYDWARSLAPVVRLLAGEPARDAAQAVAPHARALTVGER